jgi:hypothetical protein
MVYIAEAREIAERDDFLTHFVPKGLGKVEPEAPPCWFDHIEMMLVSDDPAAPVIDSYLQMHPGNGVIHGFTLVRSKGKQLNLRGCRRLEGDERFANARGEVGPSAQVVIDPFERWDVRVEENGWSDFRLDARCRALTGAELWPPMVHPDPKGNGFHTWQNYVIQHVEAECGTLTIGGESWDLTGWRGFRDHCWGYRLNRTTGGPSAHTWLPAYFPTRQLILLHREDLERQSIYSHARIYRGGKPIVVSSSDMTMKIELHDESNLPKKVTWKFADEDGGDHLLETAPFAMPDGLVWGAGWSGESHNDYSGPLRIEGDEWDHDRRMAVASQEGLGAIVRYRVGFSLDGESGYGLLASFLANGYVPA